MKKIWYTIVLAALLCGLTGCFEEEMSPAETAPVSETVVVGETELVSETANPASYQQISQEEAKRLMRECPKMKMAEVAEQSGFSSPVVFNRTFKRETDFTPMEWAQKMEKEQEVILRELGITRENDDK